MADSKSTVLLQLDTDSHPSVFDAVVAVDSGVQHLLRHGGVRAEHVRGLVYGAIFTRGVEDLRHTAVFIGGSDVLAGEMLLAEVRKTFLGPLRVSVMMDSNGANTTAAAAVLAASAHVNLRGATVLALAATGPVGRRVVQLLARQGARVRASALHLGLAETVSAEIRDRVPSAQIEPCVTATLDEAAHAAQGVQAIIASGPPGVRLLSAEARRSLSGVQVAIDLNAVAPTGLEGIDPMDRAVDRSGAICYGAIGVGGLKMKIHKAAIQRLFQSNDQVLDAAEIFEIGQEMYGPASARSRPAG